MKMRKIGEWSFIGGVILAILAGLVPTLLPAKTVAMILIVLGVFVGFLNVTEKETSSFLVAAIALLLVGAAGLEDLPVLGEFLEPLLTNIATFVAPAAVIVALKLIYDLSAKR